jgi:hypothetical protein
MATLAQAVLQQTISKKNKPNNAVHPTTTRVTLHAWSLRSRHGSRHGQSWVTADVGKKYSTPIYQPHAFEK